MSRPDRWWRPADSRRPVQRARARRVYTVDDVADGFEVGYECGKSDQRRESQRLHDGVERLTDAIRASQEGDSSLLDELGRQAAGDDLLDVADGAGVTPLADVNPDELLDEVERWLRDQR